MKPQFPTPEMLETFAAVDALDNRDEWGQPKKLSYLPHPAISVVPYLGSWRILLIYFMNSSDPWNSAITWVDTIQYSSSQAAWQGAWEKYVSTESFSSSTQEISKT